MREGQTGMQISSRSSVIPSKRPVEVGAAGLSHARGVGAVQEAFIGGTFELQFGGWVEACHREPGNSVSGKEVGGTQAKGASRVPICCQSNFRVIVSS